MLGPIIFVPIFCLSFLGVGIYRQWGIRNNVLSVPNERSSHTEPTPHGAGLVIVIICLATYIPISIFVTGTFSWGYFIGAFLIAAISFIDDIWPLRFHWRLLVHSAAAIMLIADLETWHGITMLGGLKFGVLGYILTFLWIVWMVNSYNFMDGIDGLADIEVADKDIAQAFVVILAGMNGYVLTMLIEHTHYKA